MTSARAVVPRSGQIIGLAVRALKLELPAKMAKNAQRYFGGASVKPETMSDLHMAIAQSIAFDESFVAPAIQDDVCTILFTSIESTAARWNDLAALIETVAPAGASDPLERIVELATPIFLCLSAVDLALRSGAFHRLIGVVPSTTKEAWAWAEDEHGGMLLRRLLDEAELTRDDLVEATSFSENTVDTWLDGKFRPEQDNVATIARVLSKALDRPREELARRLNRHFALASLAAGVAPIVGRVHLAEAAARFSVMTMIVHEFIGQSSLELAERRHAFLHMVRDGGAYERCYWVVNTMRRNEEDRFWMRILVASVKDWLPWLQIALSNAATVLGAVRAGMVPSAAIEELRDQIRFNLSDHLTPPEGMTEAQWLTEITKQPEHALAVFTLQGEQLMGLHEYVDAVRCFRHVVRLDPENPHGHYRLGCALWLAPFEDPASAKHPETIGWIVEAKDSLWRASQLAEADGERWNVPRRWDLPLVELGWLLGETGKIDEALAHAESLRERLGGLSDRAAFLLAHARIDAGDLVGAQRAFEECIQLNPQHQLAKEGIQACRTALRGQRTPKPSRR